MQGIPRAGAGLRTIRSLGRGAAAGRVYEVFGETNLDMDIEEHTAGSEMRPWCASQLKAGLDSKLLQRGSSAPLRAPANTILERFFTQPGSGTV